MKDATLRKTVAMPIAANTANTNTLALPQQATRPFTSTFRVILKNTAATAANTKNLNYRLYATNESNGGNAVAASEIFTVVSATTVHPISEREIALRP
jgi:hypothetical protein